MDKKPPSLSPSNAAKSKPPLGRGSSNPGRIEDRIPTQMWMTEDQPAQPWGNLTTTKPPDILKATTPPPTYTTPKSPNSTTAATTASPVGGSGTTSNEQAPQVAQQRKENSTLNDLTYIGAVFSDLEKKKTPGNREE